jgi:biotin carboxyl carrier protein
MRYEISEGERTHRVEIRELGPTEFEVRIDERDPVRIDVAKTPRTLYSLLMDGAQFEGSVDEGKDGTLDVRVGARSYHFKVVDERRKLLATSAPHVMTGKQELRAQMPGKIVKVLVEVGQQVERDQGLVVIEAMKMENELKSPVTGVVTALGVREGDTVEAAALLAVIEPPDGPA